ncbi:tetratricopeptide repeat protein [Parasphingorhabdus cellanae]|uniref:Tetratricopeptide repeat protein n=1 Tax=Parasphingorhabdus cellanae TaxID=2806553 RepID=A0ABX7T5J6_9SPHN|nr:tetratricopeptide repeat protein [Parasphingorhabdus cellanae]QTD56193.1 tetratricopeptide repeat protein [Parasphingorhabdus cellanae]
MRFLSHFSMAVALATAGTLAISALPQEAHAQKKKKKSKEAEIKISKEIRPQVAAIQEAMGGETPATAKPLVESLLAQPLEADDKFIAGQLAIQLGSSLKDTALQEKGINASIDSGKTSAEQLPSFLFFSGNFAYSGGRYAEAQQRLQQAFDAGYRQNNIGALIAEAYFKENKNQEGLAALERALEAEKASGAKAPEDWYRRGAGIAMKNNVNGAAGNWTYKLVEAYPTGENWRAALSVYRDSANPKLSNQENLELMRLMRKADAMESERDYFEYADAADPRRLPGEVVSLLEEGLAKGDVPSSSSYVTETLAAARGSVAADKASLGASERDANKSANGKIALATADALLGYGDYAKAAALYQSAISKGGVDTARAQMGLGIAQVGQSNWDDAKQAFSSVTGSRKSIANFWSLWIDQKAAGTATPEPAPTAS